MFITIYDTDNVDQRVALQELYVNFTSSCNGGAYFDWKSEDPDTAEVGSISWNCSDLTDPSYQREIAYHGHSCYPYDSFPWLGVSSKGYCEDYKLGSILGPRVIEQIGSNQEVYYLVTSRADPNQVFASGFILPGQNFTVFSGSQSTAFSDHLNITIYESDVPGSLILQSIVIHSTGQSPLGFPLQLGSMAILEIRNPKQGILDIDGWSEQRYDPREILIIVDITAQQRVRLEGLTLITNIREEVYNFTDDINGDLLDSTSLRKVDLAMTVELYSNESLPIHFTFFGTVVASNLRGGTCNNFDLYEFGLTIDNDEEESEP
jgi:hypothetical protein